MNNDLKLSLSRFGFSVDEDDCNEIKTSIENPIKNDVTINPSDITIEMILGVEPNSIRSNHGVNSNDKRQSN